MNRRAPGFSLVELLVVMLVAGLMMAAVFQTLIVQQRGYRQQFSMANARQNSRITLDLLAVELRELSAVGGDLFMATPDSLRFRSYRKVGIVCDLPGPGVLVVEEIAKTAFVERDSVYVFQEEGEAWVTTRVGSVAAVTCPDGRPGRRLNLEGPIDPVALGAPVRGYRMAAFGLESIDGKWALARREEQQAPIALVEPLASQQQGGLRFRYFDAAAAELVPSTAATRARVARIEVTVRGASPGTGSIGQREYRDSLSLQINLRGN